MIGKNVLLLVIFLAFMGACTGQEYPPAPSDALELDSDYDMIYVDDQTGDVIIRYTLTLMNITEETLDYIIVKDFKFPLDMTMEWEYFQIEYLESGVEESLTFEIIIEGWGLNPTEHIWEFYFTIGIEQDGIYIEEGFSQEIYLDPSEEFSSSSGSQALVIILAAIVLIMIAVFVAKRSTKSKKTEKSSQTVYADIVLQAMGNIKSEVLFFGVITAAFLIGLACFGLEVVRELKWVFVIVLTTCLVFYFLMKREESAQKGEKMGSMKNL